MINDKSDETIKELFHFLLDIKSAQKQQSKIVVSSLVKFIYYITNFIK